MPENFATSGSFNTANSTSGQQYTPEAQARMNQLYPTLYNRFLSSPTGPAGFSSLLKPVGGTNTPFPEVPSFGDVSTAPVYNPNQIQQQANLLRGQNQAQTEGQIRQAGSRMAGMGYGGNSPLLQSLAGNMRAQGLAGTTQAENQLRFQAAKENASQVLQAQQARAAVKAQESAAQQGRAQAISQDDISRRQLVNQYAALTVPQQNALLQALTAMNQPLSFSQSKSQGGSFSQSGADNWGQMSGML